MSLVYISSLQAGKDSLNQIKHRIAIDHVVTIDRGQAARAHVSGYAEFSDVGIDVRYLEHYSMRGARDGQLMRDLAPHLVIVNGWNRLIPPAILDLPRFGCVGFHGSWKPLPFGRGRSPISWAILNGATQFFLHLFHLDAGVDSGDIIDTVRFDITPHDTCATVHAKAGIVSAGLLLKNIPKILDGTASRIPQTGPPTYLPKRTPESGLIDWTMELNDVCMLVRAVTRPYAGAFSEMDYQGERVRMVIWDAVPFAYDLELEGQIGAIVFELDGKPLIKCHGGLLLVKDFTCSPPSRP
jgi:methionyl-tRNA formyltransferase